MRNLNTYNEEQQTVRMCLQTFFNLYGVMPGASEMIDWLGASYKEVILDCMSEMTGLRAA